MTSTETIFNVFALALLACCIAATVYAGCVTVSETETKIIEVNESNIKITDTSFYLLFNDQEIEIQETIDLSKNSSVYIKLEKNKPYLLYQGSDWEITTVLKTP